MTLRRRHVYESPDLTGRKPATVVMSNGLGVDSMAAPIPPHGTSR